MWIRNFVILLAIFKVCTVPENITQRVVPELFIYLTVWLCKGRQMLSYLGEDILSQVDDDTLMAADEVCQSWRQAIIHRCLLIPCGKSSVPFSRRCMASQTHPLLLTSLLCNNMKPIRSLYQWFLMQLRLSIFVIVVGTAFKLSIYDSLAKLDQLERC